MKNKNFLNNISNISIRTSFNIIFKRIFFPEKKLYKNYIFININNFYLLLLNYTIIQ